MQCSSSVGKPYMYYEKIAITITACALVATVLDASRRDWTAEAREAFHYTFSNEKTLDVDNIDGTIQVVGDSGNTIRVEGEKVIHAEDQQAIGRAQNEVKLDVNQKDGIAQLYVNGPFRSVATIRATTTAFTFTSTTATMKWRITLLFTCRARPSCASAH